jgi:benzoate membrane transport protein
VEATLFSITGPALLYINTAQTLGFTDRQASSWLFGCYAISGVISLVLSLYYQMPIVGAACIPGATMLATALQGYSFQEAVGAYMCAGLLVLLVGVTGIASRVMKVIPLPIVMGMVAGCMMHYSVDIVKNTREEPFLCGIAVLGYLIVPKLWKRMPGILGALILSIGSLILTDGWLPGSDVIAFTPPLFTIPDWNGAVFAAFWGGHNANIAGPMTAICASEEAGEDKSLRFGAAIVNGMLSILFGIFASMIIAFTRRIPTILVNTLAGLGLVTVLISSLRSGFSGSKFQKGAFAAFVIGLCDLTIFNISAAFWGLLFGCVISMVLEWEDFQ